MNKLHTTIKYNSAIIGAVVGAIICVYLTSREMYLTYPEDGSGYNFMLLLMALVTGSIGGLLGAAAGEVCLPILLISIPIIWCYSK